ncbi:hypothetical protein GCM10023232_19830 [Sphingosinicella ginsenosidimutans]|uniref:Uncharacterized protein n=1 Tax=Allosphingosinicella ginsenosidimutans TaxID=1176539 RepID=A0A5C6TSL0_9SPHN|nr:hypothetical protein [Sphingosinicella ginsenosidimutans]TXC63011.1 hypothetical protein FRZ32_04615 [Sphingosinicella ginsenosidimutans]
MSGVPDNDRVAPKPFLIEQDGDGFRLVLRETRYNSQHYPIITATRVGEPFSTAAAARTYAKAHLGAMPGEFATK